MKITPVQHRCLAWLNAHGGVGAVRGCKVISDSEECPGTLDPWLHLVVKGMVIGADGAFLHITDYGRRVLNPLAPLATG